MQTHETNHDTSVVEPDKLTSLSESDLLTVVAVTVPETAAENVETSPPITKKTSLKSNKRLHVVAETRKERVSSVRIASVDVSQIPLTQRIKDTTEQLVEQLDLPGPRLHAIQQLRDSTGCAQYIAQLHAPDLENEAVEWLVQITMHLEQMIMDQCKAKSNPGLSPHQWVIRLKGFLSRMKVREWMQIRLMPTYLQCIQRRCDDEEQRVKLACRDARFLFDSFLDFGSLLHRNNQYDVRPISTSFVSASVSAVGVAEADRKRRISELTYDKINKEQFPDSDMNDVRLKRCSKCKEPVELYEKQIRRATDEPSTWFWRCNTPKCDVRGGRL